MTELQKVAVEQLNKQHKKAKYGQKAKVLILLVRKKDEPNTPFYTMELNPKNNTVIQCRTLHNRSYELDESVSTFIKEYLQFLALPKKEQNEIKRQFVA